MLQEVWKPLKDIVDCGENYSVSNLGNIKNTKRGRQLKHHIEGKGKGYCVVKLCYTNRSRVYKVHRLVALAFIPNPKEKPLVNHKDGVKSNNIVSNLEWCTPSENTKHAYDTGLIPILSGEDGANAKLTDIDVVKIKELLRDEVPTPEIMGAFGISQSTVTNINTGKVWNHVKVHNFYENGEPKQKLTDSSVLEIKRLLLLGTSIKHIAKQFNVAESTITNIKTGHRWSHVKLDGFTENSKKNSKSYQGSNCGKSVLTEKDVTDIRTYAKERKLPYKEIANMFSVSLSTVKAIVYRKTWKHLP